MAKLSKLRLDSSQMHNLLLDTGSYLLVQGHKDERIIAAELLGLMFDEVQLESDAEVRWVVGSLFTACSGKLFEHYNGRESVSQKPAKNSSFAVGVAMTRSCLQDAYVWPKSIPPYTGSREAI